jgi:hypothetical protein
VTDQSGDAPAAGMIATVLRDGQRDEVAVEEPLETRVDNAPLVVSEECRRTWLNQATYSTTASSSRAREHHTRSAISSVLKLSTKLSASAFLAHLIENHF